MSPVRRLVRKLGLSFCISAGVLAITNVESIWREEQHRGDYEHLRRESRARLTDRLVEPRPQASGFVRRAPRNRSGALSDALAGVELGETNPFAGLRDLGPLRTVLAKGVQTFTRQTYRSPRYREESGYDVVSFQIRHPNQATSTIVAYLETTLDGPDSIPVILVVANGPERARQTTYRAGQLIEQRDVPLSVAQAAVNQRLNAGVPLLSASR